MTLAGPQWRKAVRRAAALLPRLLAGALALCSAAGCVYTKAPCFPDLLREGPQQLAQVEFTTRTVNPEDGPLVAGVRGWRYCPAPPCTVIDDGQLIVRQRVPATWISLGFLRVREPDRGQVPLTHLAMNDGRRMRIDDGRGDSRELTIDLAAVARLYGLGKGDLVELTIHDEQSNRAERYYFERRAVRGNGLADRIDVDVAVGVLPVPEGARDVDASSRSRGDVGRATFPLAMQLAFGWNTVSRSTFFSEFADRIDLVFGFAVVNFQGLPSGVESKTAPAIGPGIRIHRIVNVLWYFDLFGRDPVSFPALAISVDESLRVASSLLQTDVIHKQPQPLRFRMTLGGGAASSLEDVARPLDSSHGDEPVFPLGHLSFGRRWSDHWTFTQIDLGTIWIPQTGSDDDLVLLQVTTGPRLDLPLWQDRVRPFLGAQAGFFQGYLLRTNQASEVRLRSGVAIPGGISVPLARSGGLATWSATLTGTLLLVYDFAGSGGWTKLFGSELGLAVEF